VGGLYTLWFVGNEMKGRHFMCHPVYVTTWHSADQIKICMNGRYASDVGQNVRKWRQSLIQIQSGLGIFSDSQTLMSLNYLRPHDCGLRHRLFSQVRASEFGLPPFGHIATVIHCVNLTPHQMTLTALLRRHRMSRSRSLLMNAGLKLLLRFFRLQLF